MLQELDDEGVAKSCAGEGGKGRRRPWWMKDRRGRGRRFLRGGG